MREVPNKKEKKTIRKFKLLLCIALMLSAVLATPIVVKPVKATDYSVSSIQSGDFISTIWSGTNEGSAAGETKLSQDGASQSGTTVYGPNNPIIYSGISAELNGQSGCASICFLDNIKVTVTVTDSSGTVVSGSRIGDLGLLVSPADPANGGIDWANVLTETVNFLLSAKGLPSIPNFKYGATATTGTGTDTGSAWGQWINPKGLSNWHYTAKGINFRFQPNFPTPDVYTIKLTSTADMNINDPNTGADIHDTTVSWSNSFTYVYEADAGQPGDAGKDFSTARGITPGSYTGLAYGADTVDMYKFDATAGYTISFSVTPPSTARYTLDIYDPSWNFVAESAPGTGSVASVSTRAASTGSYFAKITLTSGSGTYSFSLTVTAPPPNDAQFVSQTPPPSTMTPGSTASVSVTMKNMGTATWTPTGSNPYRLGSQNPQDNSNWGFNRVQLATSVPPGAQYTFTFVITAPSTPGLYNFQWRMVQELVQWFGDFTPNIPVSVTDYAQFVSWTPPPTTMITGHTSSVSVTMKNTGTRTWNPDPATNPYRLGSQNPQDNTYWGNTVSIPAAGITASRIFLTQSVAPGASYTFSFTATAPSTPGVYNFQWRMVQENVEWFGDYTPSVSITVVSPDYSMSTNPTSLSIPRGGSGSYTVTLTSLNGFSGAIDSSPFATVTIHATDINDGNCRSFGLLFNQQLNYPDFWNSQPQSVIGTGCRTFDYTNTFGLGPTSPGPNYLEFGVSAWVGSWQVQITVNGNQLANVVSDINHHVHVNFQTGALTGNVPAGAGWNSRVSLSPGGTATMTVTYSIPSNAPTGSYQSKLTATSGQLSHSVTVGIVIT